MNTEIERQNRLEKLKKLKEEQERMSTKEKPSISVYKLKSDRSPVHLRGSQAPGFDELMNARREEIRKYHPYFEDEHTFAPDIGDSSGLARNTGDLFAWKEEQKRKLANKRLKELEDGEYRFAPIINSRSQQIVSRV
jgi:hypothetical protein